MKKILMSPRSWAIFGSAIVGITTISAGVWGVRSIVNEVKSAMKASKARGEPVWKQRAAGIGTAIGGGRGLGE
jgi:hypothetical protein